MRLKRPQTQAYLVHSENKSLNTPFPEHLPFQNQLRNWPVSVERNRDVNCGGHEIRLT